MDHNKLWEILQEIGIPEHLTCFLRNLYAGQEATVRTGHGPMNCWVSEVCYINGRIFANTSRACLYDWSLIVLAATWKKKKRTGHGTTDWFQIGEGVCQGSILLPSLFKVYAEHIMWNARLGEAQGRIKTARRNINSLRYAEDTTLMAESEEELKSLLMKVKVKVKSLSRVRLFVTPWTVVHQAPPSMGFSRQEYWSGLPWWRWKREWKSCLKTQHSEN